MPPDPTKWGNKAGKGAFAFMVHPPFGLVTRFARVIGRVRPETGGAAQGGSAYLLQPDCEPNQANGPEPSGSGPLLF